MLLALLMVMTLLPASLLTVYAADTSLSGLADTGIGLTYSDGTWSASGKTITGSVTGKEGGCGSGSSSSGTLTITNNKSSSAPLKFSYSVTLNSGSVTVTKSYGTTESWTGSGTYEETLAAGASVKIALKSAKDASTTSVTISDITLTVDVNATVTFKPAENGSYTVDGNSVTSDYTATKSSTVGFTVAATPAEGYKFLYWYSETNDSIVSTSASDILSFESNQTVYPVFVPANAAIFSVNGMIFADLNKADTYASSHGNKIVLAESGTLASGTYTISAANTLLIPFDEGETTYEGTPESTTTWSTPSAYKTLTMANGASITVNGKLSVSAKHLAASSGNGTIGGAPTGKYGYIYMENGSAITLESGSNLYAWGYISGNGTILAKSGSGVFENMQIAGFRGGSATSNMNNNKQKVFPINQYFIQNIEAALTLESGASETVYSSLKAGGISAGTSVAFIGSSGMFRMENGTTLTKTYHPDTDRVSFELNGNASINSMTVKVSISSVNSSSYVLPIMNNWDFVMHSGTLALNQDMAFLPGVTAKIDKGAMMDVASGSSIYIYDGSTWGAYAYGGNFLSVAYSPTKSYNRKNADLVDAKVDVNGTFKADGSIYTTYDANNSTTSGADICSSEGTGQVQFVNGAGSATETYQATQSGSSISYVSIPVTNAKLHNGSQYVNTDDEYTSTADATAGTTYYYHKSDGKWTTSEADAVTVTYDANGGSGTMAAQTLTSGEEGTLTSNTFTRDGYTFSGWNTAKDGTGTAYADGASVTLTEDTTLYAQWKAATYTITWNNADGTTLKTDTVAYGGMPSYSGDTPIKEADAQYTYTFKGWSPEVTAVTGDATYTAMYDQTLRSYTVTWKNDDGTVLETDENVSYGTTPEYNGETPTKSGTDQYSYAFKGWSPAVSTVTGDVTYTAEYTENTNSYTVTWNNADGTTLKTDTVAYGETPSYSGDTPTKEADAQYTYTFKGWSPEITSVTGNQTYTATYDQTLRSYTVTWKNDDGTELKTETVNYGETPSYTGETLTKAQTDEYTYTFSGWNPTISTVTGDVTYTAQFTAEKRTYTITWKNDDGTVISTVQVAYGETPKFSGDTPTKQSTEQYEYTFTGWKAVSDDGTKTDIVAVVGDATYTAQYSSNVRKYTITWKNSNGEELKTEQVEYGKTPSYDGTPSITPDAHYTATFKGWTPTISKVTADATYTAEYELTGEKHTVTFDANGGKGTMGKQTFEYGKDTALTTNTFTRENYKFDEWNTAADGTGSSYADGGSISTLTEDITLYAQWKHNDGWATDDTGKQYYKDGELQKTGWTTIENSVYYLDMETGYAATDGIYWLVYPEGYSADTWDTKNNTQYKTLGYDKNSYFIFDKDGVFQSSASGMYTVKSGTKIVGGKAKAADSDLVVWAVKGEIPWHAGLVLNDGNYYYFTTGAFENGTSYVKDRDYYISKSNGLSWPESAKWGSGTFTEGKYTFDSDGKLQLYDGFTDIEGNTYYYVKGVKTYAGLISLNGSYYYVNSASQVVKGKDYAISKTNNLLPAGKYTFDADGKMQVSVDSDGKLLNGIVKETDDTWYYYVEGVKVYAGLIKIDNDYYYVNSKYEVIHGKNYFISKTNGLMDNGTYEFDSDGKMVTKDTTKNGIVKETNDTWYYYVDGVKTYAGLIQIEGNYYYVRTNCQVVHGQSYYISKINGLMAAGTYTFDNDGKMVIEKSDSGEVLNGIVKESDDIWYYYVSGTKTYAGLIQIDGKYYYVNSQYQVIHNRKYFISKTNGLKPNGTYTFDENGVMQTED
jgi:uncharacterized repeat protein (TIGR02543 family)